eukprot:CAMPEP_0183765994 /NCGR_PEP_ID=MMETSP0739-20130205/11274_1 /TAXON_ID=385413 /ORGANISM="Thalassiosira miniscula, Strain CCMP1093" /LENGTH=513 /DNA_ID=CAMNT_0026004727 /DNA_START=26 /DNA_END=1570 /DNA_ORIENTATION=-
MALKYTRPPNLTPSELDLLTVPLECVETDLLDVLDEFGVAVVTGVIPTREELATLEQFWCNDLQRALAPSSFLGTKSTLSKKVEEWRLKLNERSERLEEEEEEAQSKRSFNTTNTIPMASSLLMQFPSQMAERLTRGAGFALENGLMHGEFAWAVRRHGNVHRAFAALFQNELGNDEKATGSGSGAGEDENGHESVEPERSQRLVTSLDVPFFSPGRGSETTSTSNAKEPQEKFLSAHVDQNPHDAREELRTRRTYQGALYVWPATDPDATATVVWPGSHRASSRHCRDRTFDNEAPSDVLTNDVSAQSAGMMGCHYCTIRGHHPKRKELVNGWKKHARIVPVPAGALLLWNSRTIHTGWKGGDGPGGGGARLAQAVCLEPSSRRPLREYISKLRLCALGLPSTHWASVGMQHDMVLYGMGWLDNVSPSSIVESEPEHCDKQPPGLPVCVDWDKVQHLGGVAFVQEKLKSLVYSGPQDEGFYLTGMWDHRKSKVDDFAEFLRELIKPEYRAFI